VLLVNLLAALNFANVFLNKKTFGKFKKTAKNVKKRDQNKNKVIFTSMLVVPPNSAIRLSVPRRCCLGYSHSGCLQLSHRRPPEMCGLQTRQQTDV